MHDELRDRVRVHVHPHGPGDLLVLHQREEQMHELLAVRRSYGLQNLGHEISEENKFILV